MHDVLTKLDNEDIVALCGMLVGVVAILGGITVAVTKVVSSHYRRSQLDEMEATLKMEMIHRGMSADDISKVLAARMESPAAALAMQFKAQTERRPRGRTHEYHEA